MPATYQLLVPLIAILFLSYTVAQHVKGRNALSELIFWSLFWVFVVLLALFPDQITDRLAKWLGIKSNINALIFLALGVLFFLQFRLYFLLKRQNHTITALIRKLALKDEPKEDDPS